MFITAWTAVLSAANEEIHFDIPAGDAIEMVKLAAYQADVELLFALELPQGAQTNAVEGVMTVDKVFERMLDETPLVAVPVSGGEAFGIMIRAEKGGNVPERSENELETLPSQKLENPEKMELNEGKNKKGLLKALTAVFAIGVSGAQGQDSAEDQEVLVLSPFTVNASDNTGYRATTTLAGSRVRTNVRDLGSSIAIATDEFMTDLGATDGDSLLQYIGNAETGGVLGNFSSADIGQNTTNAARLAPQNAQRIRGLDRAVLTRDYFTTNIPFDSYNTTRVTVNRGPNSILFGLGSPGGVINNSTRKASTSKNFGDASIRFDHNGGHRETFSINRVLVEDRLAVSFSAMNEKLKFRQDPAFEEDTRFFVAAEAVLSNNENSNVLGKTSLQASFERGDILRNPPDVLPPRDGFSSWWEGYGDINAILRVPGYDIAGLDNEGVLPQQVRDAVTAGLATVPEGQTLDQFITQVSGFEPQSLHDDRFTGGTPRGTGTIARQPYFIFPAINFNNGQANTQPGWNDPNLDGIEGIMARWRRNGFRVQDLFWTRDPFERLRGDFSAANIQNREIFDYHKFLLQGDTNRIDENFDAGNVILRQDLFGGKGGIELAFDRQSTERRSFLPFSTRDSKQVSIDITTHQAPGDADFDGVADRLPNENLGRPVIRWGDSDNAVDNARQLLRTDQDTIRATAFASFDFRDRSESFWANMLGNHTLTGLFEERTENGYFEDRRGAWWADSGEDPAAGHISNGTNDNNRRKVKAQIYLGPDARGFSSPDQVRLEPINVRLPQVGDTYTIWYFDNRGSVDAGGVNEWRIIDHLFDADISKRRVTSEAITLQSSFFNDMVKTLFARRSDDIESFARLQEDGPFVTDATPLGLRLRENEDPLANPTITDGNFNPALLQLRQDREFSEPTTTWSVVVSYPEDLLGELPLGMDLHAHYYEGESFEAAAPGINILGEVLPNPTGTTTEYGFTAEFFEGRFSVRVNWFESIRNSARGGGATGPINQIDFWLERIAEADNGGTSLFPTTPEDLALGPVPNEFGETNINRGTGTDADIIGVSSFDEYYQAIIDLVPDDIQSIYNFRVETLPNGDRVNVFDTPDGNLQTTFDNVTEGLEIDLVGELTNNLSLSLNVAQQEAIRSNSVPLALDVAQRVNENVQSTGFARSRRSPFQGGTDDTGAVYNNIVTGLLATRALDGTPSDELREWRVNAVARYKFLDGALKGFTIGGGLRYQDAVAIGNPLIVDPEIGEIVPDVDNPYLGPNELNGDLFLRYGRKLNDKVDWTVQLQARNLYRKNGSDDIPIHANPDGNVALIRIPNEQQYFLTNTFKF